MDNNCLCCYYGIMEHSYELSDLCCFVRKVAQEGIAEYAIFTKHFLLHIPILTNVI